MLDLEPKYLAIIQKILTIHAPGKTIWAYGSRIKGTAHKGSDLDLIAIDASAEQVSTLREAFSDSDLPILVDILDWATIPEMFKEEIKKAHEIIPSL